MTPRRPSTWLTLALLIQACSGRSLFVSEDAGVPDTAPPDRGSPTEPAPDASAQADASSSADASPPTEASMPIDSSSWADGVTPDPTCPACVPDITWGPDGGDVFYSDKSSITACTTYTHVRVFSSAAPPSFTCSQPVDNAACLTGAIQTVLADSDMVAALAASPIGYGVDSRPVDGQVFRLSVGAKTIDVGGDCPAGSSTCRPIPPGVKAAAEFFQSLDRAQMSQGSCKRTFPDWCSTHCPSSGTLATVCGADGVTYPDSTVASCCGVTVAHDGTCGDYAVTDLGTNALRKAISKRDAVRGLCFTVVLAFLSGPNIGIATPPGWISERGWFSRNLADCTSVGGPLAPPAAMAALRGSGAVIMTGGGGGGSRCSFSTRATLEFDNAPSEAFVADNLDAGLCP